MKHNFIVAGLTGVALVLLAAIFMNPIWWVSLTAPNYPPEAFPDGVRIHFAMNGVFNGCKKVDNVEIVEDEALDCVHEMDTINHYVGMYPIAAGGPVERAISQFLMPFLGVMLLGFACTRPALRTALLAVGFTAILVTMYMTLYSDGGFKLENFGYVEALVTSMDQDASSDGGSEADESGIVAMLRKSLAESGIKVDKPAPETADMSEKERLIDQLKVTFNKDQERTGEWTGEKEQWNGSTFQVMTWHYGKSLGRYFNNPDEIRPMVETLKIAVHVVFGALVAAALLLVVAARRTGGLFYWLLVLVPIALPVFFIIDYAAWLWFFGHNLNSMGAFTVKPFMPTVFGQGKVAQFATHSYPYIGFFLMLAMSVVLGIAALVRKGQLAQGGR